MASFNTRADNQARQKAAESFGPYEASRFQAGRRPIEPGRSAVWQARLVLLVMINVAQLWILAATVEAALAGAYDHLLPLIISSLVCWFIALTIFLWWKPASPRRTSSGYIKQ